MSERRPNYLQLPGMLEMYKPLTDDGTHVYLPSFEGNGMGGVPTFGDKYYIEQKILLGAFGGDFDRPCGGEGLILPGYDRENHDVVVKMMKAMERPEDVLRFMEVSRALKAVEHPHLATVLDATFLPGPDRLLYATMIMPRYYGTTADQVLGKGHLRTESVSEVALQIGEALDALHAANIVHGDVNLKNMYLEKGARDRRNSPSTKLIDYGSSFLVGSTAGLPRATVWHTPGFTAPEVTAEHPPTYSSDLWSLAASVDLLLRNTSLCPFTDLSGLRVRGELPDSIQNILNRGMASNPADRYSTGIEFAEDLMLALESSARPNSSSCAELVPRKQVLPPIAPKRLEEAD